MTNFAKEVYRQLRLVPAGKVVTYGQLAAMAGRPKAARAVGMLMRANPDAPRTPCHRVVASDGSLHGYSGHGGILGKHRLLQNEGVQFKSGRVDLSKSRHSV